MRRAALVLLSALTLAGPTIPRGAVAASGGAFNPLLDPGGADAPDDFAPVLIYKKPVPLRPGAGAAETAKACNACHASDAILMNSPFLTAAQWRQEVDRMRLLFGARIDAPTAATIAAYLGAHYAAQAPAGDPTTGHHAPADQANHPALTGAAAQPAPGQDHPPGSGSR